MAKTMTGPEYDLLIIRTVRDRILAGDWSAHGPTDDRGHMCLVRHLTTCGIYSIVAQAVTAREGFPVAVGLWNDTHTQAEVVALLDDVEDSLLGEMGL